MLAAGNPRAARMAPLLNKAGHREAPARGVERPASAVSGPEEGLPGAAISDLAAGRLGRSTGPSPSPSGRRTAVHAVVLDWQADPQVDAPAARDLDRRQVGAQAAARRRDAPHDLAPPATVCGGVVPSGGCRAPHRGLARGPGDACPQERASPVVMGAVDEGRTDAVPSRQRPAVLLAGRAELVPVGDHGTSTSRAGPCWARWWAQNSRWRPCVGRVTRRPGFRAQGSPVCCRLTTPQVDPRPLLPSVIALNRLPSRPPTPGAAKASRTPSAGATQPLTSPHVATPSRFRRGPSVLRRRNHPCCRVTVSLQAPRSARPRCRGRGARVRPLGSICADRPRRFSPWCARVAHGVLD